jgi:hypothetical protein
MFRNLAFSGALWYIQQVGDGDATATLSRIWPSPARPRSMPLVLRLPQGFSPSPPPCPTYGRMRMSDDKPHISFAGRFTDGAIATSFKEVAPSSPLLSRPAVATESTMAWSKFRSFKAEKGDTVAVGAVVQRRDLYEVLRVERNATEQEIKSVFCRMTLKYAMLLDSHTPLAA